MLEALILRIGIVEQFHKLFMWLSRQIAYTGLGWTDTIQCLLI